MRPSRFPRVTDAVLAEALRQLIPIAQEGVAALNTSKAFGPLARAHLVLEMWCRQERGRKKLLAGPLPAERFWPNLTPDDPCDPDPGQNIPAALWPPSRP